jgi:hypothetical protein
MDEDTLNMSVRKYLKTVGVTAQREIERAITGAADRLPSGAKLKATTHVTVPDVGLDFTVEGELDLG